MNQVDPLMHLETLLILLMVLMLVLITLAHRCIIQPTLRRNGYQPRGMDDVLLHRDWNRYRYACGGGAVVYWLLWLGYLLAIAAVVLLAAQCFLFPGIRIGA
ncbi:MAG: hypothetical protein ACIAXF_16570 [Phycisphaerales bacterium JB063]